MIIRAKIQVYSAKSSCRLQCVSEAQAKVSGFTRSSSVACTPETLTVFAAGHALAQPSDLELGGSCRVRFVVKIEYGTEVGIEEGFATFGIQEIAGAITNEEGKPYTQAGGHPYEPITTIRINSTVNGEGVVAPAGNVKDVRVQLPPG